MKKIYLTHDQFKKGLEDELIIRTYPSKRRGFYTCELIKPCLSSETIRVYVYDESTYLQNYKKQ